MRMLPMGKCCQFQFPMIHWKWALVIGNIFTLATFFGATAAETPWIDERYETAGETGAWTPELRKAVSTLLVKAANRINAVYDLDPDNEKAEQAIGKVCALIEEYKLVAAEAKGKKKEDPEPEPAPEKA